MQTQDCKKFKRTSHNFKKLPQEQQQIDPIYWRPLPLTSSAKKFQEIVNYQQQISIESLLDGILYVYMIV